MRASPEGEATAIEHPERCAVCGSCRLVCPAGAIDVYKE
ncbi:4Fe-4S binding protein [Cloacibacillus evryensis]